MKEQQKDILIRAYEFFNARNIDSLLPLMHSDVDWPNGWEGGYVHGHAQVRDYWTRQWKEIDPTVIPESFKELEDERIEVNVHQVVKDNSGTVLLDGFVKHIYTFDYNLVKNMQIISV